LAPKESLTKLMNEANLTVASLAQRSGVSEPTARRAARGDSTTRLNTTSATKIAAAFGSKVGDINWPGGLANEGRPAGSGGRYTRRSG